LADRVHLLCYGFDPVRGLYTERITTLLAVAGLITVVVMVGGIFAMVAVGRGRTAS
jgi:protein SCO1